MQEGSGGMCVCPVQLASEAVSKVSATRSLWVFLKRYWGIQLGKDENSSPQPIASCQIPIPADLMTFSDGLLRAIPSSGSLTWNFRFGLISDGDSAPAVENGAVLAEPQLSEEVGLSSILIWDSGKARRGHCGGN